MANQGFTQVSLEEVAVKNKRLAVQVILRGSTTAAGITAMTSGSPGFAVYTEQSSLTAPSDANFASLLSTATPTVIGLYVLDGYAVRMNRVSVDTAAVLSASMTSGSVTYKGATQTLASGSGRTGVTSGGNLAFQVQCLGLKLTDSSNIHNFSVDVEYDVL